MNAQFTPADATRIVEHQGHDPNSWNGARLTIRLLCNQPHEDPQLGLFIFDELLDRDERAA